MGRDIALVKTAHYRAGERAGVFMTPMLFGAIEGQGYPL